MSIQKILVVPNPILRQKAKKIQKIDKKTLKTIKGLKDTFTAQRNPKGAGISAPQIGRSVSICLVLSKEDNLPLTLINPEIVWKSKQISGDTKENPFEGCLSVPGLWGQVKRPKEVKVRFQTEENKIITKKFTGFTNTIVQHEIDHLEGILFIDRILEQKGKLYKIEKNKEDKEELVEVALG